MNTPVTPKTTFGSTVKAVAWSFLGVRRGKDFQDDIGRLKPQHVIAAGLIGGILFVLSLIALVNWVVLK